MAKQVIRYRTCDKCTVETEAAVTDKLTFNGSKYDLDLCEKHSLELFSAMMKWLDLGTKTGDTGIWDQQRAAKVVTVNVDVKPTPAAAKAVVDVPLTPVVPLRKVLADDPNLPLTASRWQLTKHAEQRMKDRHLSLADVLWAAEVPEWTVPSKQDDSLEVRRRGACKLVVDPLHNVIVTVIDKDEDARDEFVNDFLHRDRKAQG